MCVRLFIMWYSLNLARLSLGSEIEEVKLGSYNDLKELIDAYFATTGKDRVYLYQYGGLENPIIISCNPEHIYKAFYDNTGFREHHIHEYESYDDAYKVAKDMMEGHPLCYS